MSEPDSAPRRRPPTIDLTAKEVETEASAAAQDSPGIGAAAERPTASEGRRWGSSAKPYAIGILIGAVAVAAVAAGFWLAGLVPASERPTKASEAASRSAPATNEIWFRPRPDPAVAARAAAAETQVQALADSLTAISHRLDDVAATAKAGVQQSEIEALVNRVAVLEGAFKSLSADVAQRTSNADDRAARAVVAAEALRAVVERGAPYQAELAAMKSLGADQSATAVLEPFAVAGVASAAALARELSALVPALARVSESEQANGSFLGRLQSRAQRLVRITPPDAAAAPAPSVGNDAASVIARIGAAAGRADVAAARADIGRLPDAARAVAASWLKEADAREAAIAASERIAADALAALAKPAQQ